MKSKHFEHYANLSEDSSSTNNDNEGIEMVDLEKRKKIERQFIAYFSFGKYLELHQRVEYLENELDRKTIVKKRYPASNITPGQEGGILYRFDSDAMERDSDEE